MGLIGKKVKASGYNGEIEGIVMDKYLDFESVTGTAPSGSGGFMNITRHASREYYIIEDDKGEIHNIRCSNIRKIISRR
jgi:hypothetical protein